MQISAQFNDVAYADGRDLCIVGYGRNESLDFDLAEQALSFCLFFIYFVAVPALRQTRH